MKSIYLDFAAATPLSETARKAMEPYFSEKFYNPSALYLRAREVRADMESARHEAAIVLGVRPSEVIFTAGGTEANNLAIHGVMQQYPGKQLIVSATEHDSVLEPARQYQAKEVGVGPDGLLNLGELEKSITDETVLISIHYVNNEIGTIQPLKKIRSLVDAELDRRRKRSDALPLYLHTDACQAGNYLSLLVNSIGVDFMTINGGKIYGPKQSGLLYVRAGIRLYPLLQGGGQEFSLRSGTENVPAIVGLVAALKEAQARREEETRRMRKLQTLLIEQLQKASKEAVINGSLEHRIANNVHVTFPGIDNERLMMQLDERGVQCAVGSACSASKEEPSHVLTAIGLNDELARASLRFSFGRSTTAEDLEYALDQLAAVIV